MKLSATQVRIIQLLKQRRNPYVAPPKHAELAQRFGISTQHVWQLITPSHNGRWL